MEHKCRKESGAPVAEEGLEGVLAGGDGGVEVVDLAQAARGRGLDQRPG